jgi:S-adenosylmethionine-diacylglycerol 3-amino-3-carboxypropyl transferase
MVWEDPNLLFESIPQSEKLNILSIGSAGCNCLSLLLLPDSRVTAVDLSTPQIHLINLKIAAIKSLTRHQYLHFFGYVDYNENRLEFYNKLKALLPKESIDYWNNNTDLLKEGIIHKGKLESYFKVFFEKAIKSIFSNDELSFLLDNKDLEKQSQVVFAHQNEIESFMSSFFNKKDLAQKARSEAQFRFVKEERPIEFYLIERTLKALNKHLISENPYLYYIFNGKFSLKVLPDHLSKENFQLLKDKIDNLTVLNSDLESLCQKSTEKFNFFNLSDIFEYMSEEHFEALLEKLSQMSKEGATIGYWSLFVDRKPQNKNKWIRMKNLSEKLYKKDRVWFYKDYSVLELA